MSPKKQLVLPPEVEKRAKLLVKLGVYPDVPAVVQAGVEIVVQAYRLSIDLKVPESLELTQVKANIHRLQEELAARYKAQEELADAQNEEARHRHWLAVMEDSERERQAAEACTPEELAEIAASTADILLNLVQSRTPPLASSDELRNLEYDVRLIRQHDHAPTIDPSSLYYRAFGWAEFVGRFVEVHDGRLKIEPQQRPYEMRKNKRGHMQKHYTAPQMYLVTRLAKVPKGI